MNLNELLQRVFKTEATSIKALGKGLTNDNYLIVVDSHSYVLRVPKSDAAHIVNFTHEAQALHCAKRANLDVDTRYYDQTSGVKITRYINDLSTFDEYHGTDKITRTAMLMKRLHALKETIGYDFDPVARYHQYRSYVKIPLIDDTSAEVTISSLENIEFIPTLCHNDWVSGNICFSPRKDYLIDYEYAGDNDPFFDVMSFLTENELTPEDRTAFLNAYFDHPLSSDEKTRLAVYERFHNLLWCTWASMMYESRQDEIYLKIARAKAKAYLS